jgi:hypothetical protein
MLRAFPPGRREVAGGRDTTKGISVGLASSVTASTFAALSSSSSFLPTSPNGPLTDHISKPEIYSVHSLSLDIGRLTTFLALADVWRGEIEIRHVPSTMAPPHPARPADPAVTRPGTSPSKGMPRRCAVASSEVDLE